MAQVLFDLLEPDITLSDTAIHRRDADMEMETQTLKQLLWKQQWKRFNRLPTVGVSVDDITK